MDHDDSFFSVTSLRDGIFHEFKKYGKVKSVLVRGDGAERHALVLFRTAAEANKAVAHARTKLLFGAAIEASIYEGEGKKRSRSRHRKALSARK